MTDQQTGQKIQIVTALEPSSPGKQQYILANADYSPGGKVILAKQEGSPNKVIISGHEGSGVNQVLFASSDLLSQQIQVLDVFILNYTYVNNVAYIQSPKCPVGDWKSMPHLK